VKALTSKFQKWATPDWLFQALHAEFDFSLDPCAEPSTAKTKEFFSEAGLDRPWAPARVFMNPPYNQVGEWMAKALDEIRKGALVVALVPVRTESRWWRNFAEHGEIRFFAKRIRFIRDGKPISGTPFGSAVVIFHPPKICGKQR
jgi:site-specific DNA-methyltransferase (adenine-specific)